MSDPIRVIIVDDHKTISDGMSEMLSHSKKAEVIGTFTNGEDLFRNLDGLDPEVLFLDHDMPGENGIEITERIRKKNSDFKIIMLTMYSDAGKINSAIKAGVNGFLIKGDTGKADILEAIDLVMKGEQSFSTAAVNSMMKGIRDGITDTKEKENLLTPREKDVLCLITEEYTTMEIADELHISNHTVESHRKNLIAKTGAKNIAGLVRFAISNGLCKD